MVMRKLNKEGIKRFLRELLFAEDIRLDIDVGDVLLGGKWKNKRIIVRSIGEDELGQPTINGKSLLNMRIEKDMPEDKKSKETREHGDDD